MNPHRSGAAAHKAAAAHFVHSGAPTMPRVVDCVLQQPRELRVTVPARTNLGGTLRAAIGRFRFGGGVGRICSGTARGLRYHMMVTTGDARRPYGYGDPVDVTDEVGLVSGAITVVRMVGGETLLHCHAGFSDSSGELHGGHVMLDRTWAGSEPVVVRMCLFADGGYVTREDQETHFNLLHPVAGGAA